MYDRQTDRQIDGQKGLRHTVRCITCTAVARKSMSQIYSQIYTVVSFNLAQPVNVFYLYRRFCELFALRQQR